MNYLDLIVAILTGLAVIVPFVIPLIERKDKLKRTVYLIELLKTKEELIQLIKQQKRNDNSPILIDKLESNLEDIENDIYSARRKFRFEGIIIIAISIEIFFIFNLLSGVIIEKSYETGLYFLEGILRYPVSRIFLLLILIIFSFIATMKLSKKIKVIITNTFWVNLIVFGIFNILMFSLGIIMFFTLKYSDSIIPWY